MKKSSLLLFLTIFMPVVNKASSFLAKFDLWPKDKEEIVTHEQIVTAGSKISIQNARGAITINTWKKPQILIEATKKGTEEEMRLTKIETLYTKDGASIKTIALKPNRQCIVDYSILIPQNAILSSVQTNKGDVAIQNVSTPITAHVEYGSLTFQNITNSVQATTKNGSISIQAQTLKPSTKIVALAQKGSIKLELPTDTHALLYAKTDKGIVSSDQPITLEPRTLKISHATLAELRKDVRGSLGNGGTTTIKLHTSRGNVKVLEA